jgi:hypothetical protein
LRLGSKILPKVWDLAFKNGDYFIGKSFAFTLQNKVQQQSVAPLV